MGSTAIIGGGIGGLTAGIALQQRGLEARVYDAAPSLEEVGAGIWMPPNAMQVLERLGLAEEVEAAGSPVRRMEIRDRNNRLIKRAELEPLRDRYGCGTVAIHRGRLQSVLLRHLSGDGVRTNHRCVAIHRSESRSEEAGGGPASIEFEGGRVVQAEVVIGADGLRSAVRRYVAPGVRPLHSGQLALRGISPVALPESRRGMSGEFWGPGIRFGLVALGPDETYWWCAVDLDGNEVPDLSMERILHLARRFPDPVAEVVERTGPEVLIRTPLLDLPPLPRWSRGRVVLLGDAAHAMTPSLGQGGAQAIEDAWVLGRLLPETGMGDASRAFREYERIRRRRTRTLVRLSRWVGRLAHLSRPGLRRFRDLTLRHTPRWMDALQESALYSVPDPGRHRRRRGR